MGVDLVEWQLRAAAGLPLPVVDQGELNDRLSGHAIEARVYAEAISKDNGFLPATGKIQRLIEPVNDPAGKCTVRVDTGIQAGDEVSIFYDPMISKLIVHGENRDSALEGMQKALREYKVLGLPSNLSLLERTVSHEAFRAGGVTTAFLEDHGDALLEELALAPRAVAVGVLAQRLLNDKNREALLADQGPWSLGHSAKFRRFSPLPDDVDTVRVNVGEGCRGGVTVLTHAAGHLEGWTTVTVPPVEKGDDAGGEAEEAGTAPLQRNKEYHLRGELSADGTSMQVTELALHKEEEEEKGESCFSVDVDTYEKGDGVQVIVLSSPSLGRCASYEVEFEAGQSEWSAVGEGGAPLSPLVVAPMPGRVVRFLVQEGDVVKKGSPLVILEAMKMEHVVAASGNGRISAVVCAEGTIVQDKQVLMELVILEEGDASAADGVIDVGAGKK